MPTTPEYDALVEKLMGHKITQLSEAETAKEIAEVTEGVFAEREEGNKEESAMDIVMRATANSGADESKLAAMFPVKKKRGRPKGSKNKPKTDAKA